MKRVQNKIRGYLARKKIKQMDPHLKSVAQMMIFKWMMSKHIVRKQKASQTIRQHILVQSLRKKLYTNLNLYRQ